MLTEAGMGRIAFQVMLSQCRYQCCDQHVSQCLLHMPQFMPEFRTFAVLSAVPMANSIWGMCSKHCNSSVIDKDMSFQDQLLQSLVTAAIWLSR